MSTTAICSRHPSPIAIVRALASNDASDSNATSPGCGFPPGTAQVVLNAPDRRNALDADMCAELCAALKELDADKNTRVILLRAEGKAFSAGGDVKAMAERTGMFAGDPEQLTQSYQNTIQQIPLAMRQVQKPVVACIEGPAIGAGFDLACMCDIRIATPAARFAESFATLGLISGIGGAWFLTRLIGHSRALEISLSGRTISAEEAHGWGLIHHLVRPEELNQTLHTVIQTLLDQSAAAQAAAKELFWELAPGGVSLEDHLQAAAKHQGKFQHLPDHNKRVQRMLERLAKSVILGLAMSAAAGSLYSEAEAAGSAPALRVSDTPACAADASVAELLSRAATFHPSVHKQNAEAAGLAAQAERAGRQPDPMIMLSRERMPLGFKGQDGVSTWMLSVTQNFLPLSVASARENSAASVLQMAQVDALRAKQGLSFRILDSLITLSELNETARLERENLDELKKLVPLVQTVYQHDLRSGSHSGLISTEVAQELASLSVSQTQRQIDVVRAEISYLTRCPGSAVQANGLLAHLNRFLDQPVTPSHPELFSTDSTLASIAAQEAIRRSQTSLKMSETNTRFGLSIAAMHTDAEDRFMWTIGVSATLPVARLLDSDAFDAEQKAVDSWSDSAGGDFTSDRTRAVQQIETRMEEVNRDLKLLVTSIQPRAREHTDALYSDFAQGRASAREVIDGRRQLLDLDRAENMQRHSLLRSRLDLLKAQAGWLTPGATATLSAPRPSAPGSSSDMAM